MKCTSPQKNKTVKTAKTVTAKTTARTRRRQQGQQRYAATVWDQVVDDAYLMGKLSERIETGSIPAGNALEHAIRTHNEIAENLALFLKDLSAHMNSSGHEQQHDDDYICQDCLDEMDLPYQSPNISRLVH
jgi:hypothetical protein